MCDLIVRHGRVIDGTGAPWFRADVAVEGGRIVGVGRASSTLAQGVTTNVAALVGHGSLRVAAMGCHDRAPTAAEMVVFDPERVAQTADFDRPYRYPAGIDWVVVNGRVAVDSGRLQDTRTGQVLRRAA